MNQRKQQVYILIGFNKVTDKATIHGVYSSRSGARGRQIRLLSSQSEEQKETLHILKKSVKGSIVLHQFQYENADIIKAQSNRGK